MNINKINTIVAVNKKPFIKKQITIVNITEIKKVMNGDPPFSDDEDKDDGSASLPSVTAIPKTKPKAKPSGTMEPEPS